MRKVMFVLVVLSILLVACESIPPGNYLIIPLTVTGTWEPDYTYCQYGQCWNAQLADGIFAPTDEVYSTEVPPTATPNLCMITPKDSNINVRASATTSAKLIAIMRVGYETRALAYSNGWYKIWWAGDSDYPTPQYGWTKAEFYSTTGDCSNLPLS